MKVTNNNNLSKWSLRINGAILVVNIVMLVIMVNIYYKIPAMPYESDISLYADTPVFGDVRVFIWNWGNYISNGTIDVLLLENGTVTKENHSYTGSIPPHGSLKLRTIHFKDIKASQNYSVYVRVKADSRVADIQIEATW